MTQTTQQFHPVQAAYQQAKTAYDAACTAHTAALEARNFFTLLEQETDTDTLVAIELDAETESGHDAAFMAWRTAKEALFTWGKEHALHAARARKNKQEAALVAEMFTKIHQFPHLEDKLIAICLHLDMPLERERLLCPVKTR